MAEEKRTPEELAQAATEKGKAKELREKFLNEVRIAVNSASENPNVRILLRYIMVLSGYQVPPVVIGANGEIQVSSTVYNAGREAVYHDLRKSMSAETKNIVERSE